MAGSAVCDTVSCVLLDVDNDVDKDEVKEVDEVDEVEDEVVVMESAGSIMK